MKEVKIVRIRNIKSAKDIIDNCPFVIKSPEDYKGKYHKLFGNNNPIHLEIGMGKGKFLLENAIENPNINFIGIEKYDTIVAKAIEKITPLSPPNLKIIRTDALELENILSKEIDLIYLNFSDPWPKKKHEKRRLTSSVFLSIYDKVFKDENIIIQKTDNISLFESSIKSLIDYGYEIEEVNYNLSNSSISNIETEYEKKFKNLGIKINYLKARK